MEEIVLIAIGFFLGIITYLVEEILRMRWSLEHPKPLFKKSKTGVTTNRDPY